jgi:hypothetical protein
MAKGPGVPTTFRIIACFMTNIPYYIEEMLQLQP